MGSVAECEDIPDAHYCLSSLGFSIPSFKLVCFIYLFYLFGVVTLLKEGNNSTSKSPIDTI